LDQFRRALQLAQLLCCTGGILGKKSYFEYLRK